MKRNMNERIFSAFYKAADRNSSTLGQCTQCSVPHFQQVPEPSG